MQRKHVVMLAGEDFVAGLNDQFVSLIVEPLAGVVRGGGGLLQDGVGGDHLAGNQILADAEMLERALGLGAPQLVRRHLDHAEAVCFLSHLDHGISPKFSSASGRLDQTPAWQTSSIARRHMSIQPQIINIKCVRHMRCALCRVRLVHPIWPTDATITAAALLPKWNHPIEYRHTRNPGDNIA